MRLLPFILLGLTQADPSLLWPRPISYQTGNEAVLVDTNMDIEYPSTSNRLTRAIVRFRNRLSKQRWSPIVPTFKGELNSTIIPSLSIKIKVNDTNELFSDKTRESYMIKVDTESGKGEATIQCDSIYGAIHGLESLIQMTQWDHEHQKQFINKVPFSIKDGPKFSHRGLLLDTSRNYYPMDDIKRTIDGLSMNKMNVFHWHLIDSHSWPFQSEKYPLLSKKGALIPDQIYSFENIRSIVEYGLDRGVRVIPEMEAPAHAYAMTKAYPELATCLDRDQFLPIKSNPNSVQLNPIDNQSITIVKDVITEFIQLFPDHYIHLSGDEVDLECWKQNKTIKEYLSKNNLSIEQVLVTFFMDMYQHAIKHKQVIVWQEAILLNKIPLPNNTLVQVWKDAIDTKRTIELGYNVIASSSEYWYLDCGRGYYKGGSPTKKSWCDPFKHWQRIYTYDLQANLTSSQVDMVKGGEVAVWSEQVDPSNLDIVTWPRTSSAAEVLWSGNKDPQNIIIDAKTVLPRFNNFRYYLVANGLRAEALQPLWCVMNPGRCDSDPL